MELLHQINQAILFVADPLFNGLLHLNLNVTVVIVALLTATVLTVLRKFASNQDLLQRCHQDKITLTKRIKELKKHDHTEEVNACIGSVIRTVTDGGVKFPEDGAERLRRLLRSAWKKSEVKRLKEIKNQIAMKTLKQEGLPLLVALLPLAILGTWCFARLGAHPPKAHESVRVAAHFPFTDIGKIAHLVPQDGMTIENGAVHEVEKAELNGIPYGRIEWSVHAEASKTPYPIQIRYHNGDTYEHELLVGQKTYSEPLKLECPSGERAVEIVMTPFQVLGIIPGVGFLAPWLVAYILITIPVVPLLKRTLKIY